jgi:hypothetical protein
MSKLADRAKMFTSTVGVGALVLTDVVAGHQSFEAAGVTTGDTVSYAIEEGGSWEIGRGVYNASSNTLTRIPSASSNNGNQILLAGGAVVYVTVLATDIITADQFAPVATTGAYTDLSGLPTLGTAAATAATAYATAAQGALATTALQPSDLVASVRTLWVDPAGDDANDGDLPTAPLATVGAAVAKADPGDIIRVRSGIYTETCPMILPRDVSVFGDGLRNVEIRPTDATKNNNMWLVDSGTYLWGMTFARHQVGSFAVAFNAAADNTGIGATGLGAFISKSPYIQNCSSYTAAQDAGTAGSTSVGATGGGMEIDGAKCAPNSPIRSMVVDSYTQVNLNGLGCVVKNDAYAQLVSFFGTFCSEHVRAESGGQVNLSNSTTNFGTYGLVANGRSTTPIFSGTAAAAVDAVTTITVDSMTTSRIGPSSRPAAGMVFEVASTTYTVTGALPNGTGWDVNFYPTLGGALTGGETVGFFQRSQISTGGHVMEFVGSGTNYNALPWFGGVPIPANEIVEASGGRVFFSSTDQLGNFRVGPQFDVNGTTGAVTINTDQFNLSGLNAIGPFSRDGFTSVGVQLQEISNNTSLLASTGAADGNTAPTQFAVKTYLDTNYTLTSALATVATTGAYGDLSGLPTLGTAAATAITDYATAAQGALADSAVQPGDLATVATSGAYADLSGLPTLGTAAATAITDYATAAQGALADSAVQPGDLATVATSGAYADLSGLPTLGTAAATAITDYATAAQGALADSAVQPGDLATVATTGAYADLSGLPTLGTAAALDVGTSANQVVQLDGSARLPAVDGSQLINLPGGDGTVAGPASSLDNEIAVFNGTDGTSIKGAGFVMPVEDGTNGQALKTDGAGNLSFGDAGSSVAYTKTTFTATAAQTDFTVAYTVGYADVFLNGAKLSTSDYTATNGTSIVLATGAVAGDIVEVLAWTTAELANVVPATGGTFSGPVTFSGNIEVGGAISGPTTFDDIVAFEGGAVTFSGNIEVGGAISGPTTFDDNVAFEGGAVTFSGNIEVGGAISGPTTFDDNVAFEGSIQEQVFALTGTTPTLNPANGTVQTHTLSGATTYTDGLAAGQAITLLIDDGAGNTITWPTMTWINNAGAAPTLATDAVTVIALWKVSTTLYGALVGDGS